MEVSLSPATLLKGMVSPNNINTNLYLGNAPDNLHAMMDPTVRTEASSNQDPHSSVNGMKLTNLHIEQSTGPPSIGVTPPHRGDNSEVQSEDEEYFEEFHLPNTGENAFVRHQSFRRKVQLTDIDAPDAERIEGLVRTGDFHRHGSIRRKIIPDEKIKEIDEFDIDVSNLSDSFSNNIKEIESLIERANESALEGSCDGDPSPSADRNIASTPFAPRGPHAHRNPNQIDISVVQATDTSSSSCNGCFPLDESSDHSLSIEQSTLMKLKDCLDYSNYKDIYNLSGRLQDILSPKEIEEVLNNSDRYSDIINSEIIEALSMSLHDLSKSDSTNPDSGFSSPKPPEAVNKVPEEGTLPSSASVDSAVKLPSRETDCDSIPKLSNTLNVIQAPAINLDSSSDVEIDNYFNESMIDSSNLTATDSSVQDSSFHSAEEIQKDGSGLLKNKLIMSKTTISSTLDGAPTDHEPSELERSCKEPSTSVELATEAFPPDEGIPRLDSMPPPPPPDLIPELSAEEEYAEERHWRNVVIGGSWRRIDMKVITPYKKCISHGGYSDGDRFPIIVLNASLLPEKSRRDYHYVMDNLFIYVLSYLEHIVSDDYVLVYLAGGRRSDSEPGFHWMRKAYQMIDRRLKKNLKRLLVVHPTLWARTIITLSRPFISSKFYRKLHFVYNLTDLAQLVPLEQLEIPEAVKQADFELMIKQKKRILGQRR